ncbi:hypothetical protein J9317_08775 [Metabacillus sp. KIGAM252]|uniref:Uncharacterized protein n=1 Tax=Metabacillus flavus TaxID=2823519 RepID=A0ABS5LDN5_9BACI|nr:hypothetical protein [Metabacillus flavus]MBS2968850.1 hypothetical protein [Metabacillus flavus]
MPAELDLIWKDFLDNLSAAPSLSSVRKTVITGIPFLYITADFPLSMESLSSLIDQSAKKAMLYKKVTCKTVFVRNEGHNWVYRHRFYVPQEKMFCCGNLCPDCILNK